MRSHEVGTSKGAARWTALHSATELPLTVRQWECSGCGRPKYEVYTVRGKCIERHG